RLAAPIRLRPAGRNGGGDGDGDPRALNRRAAPHRRRLPVAGCHWTPPPNRIAQIVAGLPGGAAARGGRCSSYKVGTHGLILKEIKNQTMQILFRHYRFLTKPHLLRYTVLDARG